MSDEENKKKIEFLVSDSFFESLEKYWNDNGFGNRSEFIRNCLRKEIFENKVISIDFSEILTEQKLIKEELIKRMESSRNIQKNDYLSTPELINKIHDYCSVVNPKATVKQISEAIQISFERAFDVMSQMEFLSDIKGRGYVFKYNF